jgi:hypothetical protein
MFITDSFLCHKKFNDSPLFKMHITIPRHFDESLDGKKVSDSLWRDAQMQHEQKMDSNF